MAKMGKVIKGPNIEIQVDLGFARVPCNDVPEDYLQTLNILNVIALINV